MADIIELKTREETEAERAADLYRRMNFDTSNVVFAPTFCARAREAYAKRGNDNGNADVA